MTPNRSHRIRGSKGASTPREESDTLRSTQRGEVVDLLGEGVIGGLVNGLKSVYLDGVPVENIDGTRNFPEFGITLTRGGETDESAYAFGEQQTEVSVGVTVLAAVPVVRTITDATADKVRVTITVPVLMETKENGDRVGASFEWAIDIQSAGGGYVTKWTDTVAGKASAPYSRAVVLQLAEVGPPPWDIRVRRITADSASGDLLNAFAWGSYTVISGVKMLYRNSAVARITFDAKNFSAVPSRWYDLVGLSDWDIPINYDPIARTVSGVWNGLWKQGPTNNPAWVLHNLVAHRRYGLGQYVVQLPDKWTLYQLAQWCDVPVPDGRGGTEPRYSINAWIVEQKDALRLLQDICSVFRGVLMHSGATLTVTWDAPGEPVASYAPANVVDGLFTYADGSNGAVRTSCTCWYTDRGQAGKRVPATWDDTDLVERYGLRSMEIDPLGVSTPAQALRMAKWALYTAQYENGTVTFRVGSEGQVRQVGEVFQVTDPGEAGERLGGRIRSATASQVVLDAPVVLAVGQTYTLWVTLPDPAHPDKLLHQQRAVTTAAGTVGTINVSPAFSSAPLANTVWVLEGSDVAPTLWRYVSIQEAEGEEGAIEYDVMGVRHVPGKWELIEADQPLTIPPVRRLRNDVPRVQSLSITEVVWTDPAGTPHSTVTVSWVPAIRGLRFVLGWRRDLGAWTYLPPTSATTMDFVDVQPGVYEVQVQSLDNRNRLSVGVVEVAVITGAGDTVPNVTGLAYDIKPGQVVARWNRLANSNRFGVELRVGATWETADFLWAGQSSDYKHARPANGTYKLWAAHTLVVNGVLVYSPAPASIDITVDDSIDVGGAAGGRLQLTADRGPYFLFADATTHASASPQIVFTCAMLNAAGDVTWTARAFDGTGTDIGAVALSGTDGLVRSMSAAQFVAPGTLGSVREVRVTVTHPKAGSDFMVVYRRDPSTTTPTLFLSNWQAPVPTDVNGLNGDYSDATTQVQVITGLTDETALYTISINPDPGMTATVNGGAGPVTTALVNVAVSDSTIDDGYVGISAARSGFPTLMAAFRVSKVKGSDGLRIYWDPRAEIVLPVGSDGVVSTWGDAWSTLQIDRGDGFSDVANWRWSAEFLNCVGTQVDNRVDVTALAALGVSGGSEVSSTVPSGLGWNGLMKVAYDGVQRWVATGVLVGSPVNHTKVIVSDDYVTWTSKDVGDSAIWRHLVNSAGAMVLIDENFGHRVRRSTDGGETWSAGGSFVSAGQITGVFASDTTIIAATYAGTASQKSTNGGQSWSAFSLPGGVMDLFPLGGNEWLGRDTNGKSWRSIDNGVTWVEITAQVLGAVWNAMRFKGRTFFSFWTTTTKIGFIEGSSAVQLMSPGLAVALQAEFTIIEDVLYVQTGSGWAYTTDGLTWVVATGLGATSSRAVRTNMPVKGAYIPLADGSAGFFVKRPLAATSDTDADVVLTATQAGKTNVRRVLPVRKSTFTRPLFAFGADPGQINLRATSDGYVTDFGPATCTAIIRRDGVPDAANWTVTWTATGMTPSSGSGLTATFTGMTPGLARATLSYLATRDGYADVRGDVPIVQLRDGQSSGYRQGSSFMVVDDQSNTYLGLRFTTDGWAQIKRGSGGSWVNYVPWSGAPGTPGIGSGTWIKVIPEPGAPALTSGTINTWLGLSSTREYIYQDASGGVHTWRAAFLFSNSASGTDPLAASGGLMLIVP